MDVSGKCLDSPSSAQPGGWNECETGREMLGPVAAPKGFNLARKQKKAEVAQTFIQRNIKNNLLLNEMN